MYTALMKPTPFFPAWQTHLAPRGSRLARTFQSLRAATLSQLEDRFAACVPHTLFPKAPDHGNSRDRIYTRRRTFWSMLWQSLNPEASGREVVRQLQALFQLHGGPKLSPEDGAYCRAKGRLPKSEFPKALAATAQAAEAAAPPLPCSRAARSRSSMAPRSPCPIPPQTGRPIRLSKARNRTFP